MYCSFCGCNCGYNCNKCDKPICDDCICNCPDPKVLSKKILENFDKEKGNVDDLIEILRAINKK